MQSNSRSSVSDPHPTTKERASKWREFPTDILEIVFGDLSLHDYNAFRHVCKTWHVVLLDTKWYRNVRRNTLLPITSKGQSQAMCKNGFGGIRLTRGISWSYADDPWGYSPYHAYYLMYWHVDVLNAINKYIIEGGDNNVFCFNSTNVGWGRTEFTKFLGRMGAASDGHKWHRFERDHGGNAYKQAGSIKSQILDTVRRGLFPLVAVDIMSGYVGDKNHMQHIANILRQLRRFRVFGIYVPVVVFAKRYGPSTDIFPTTAANWISNVRQEKDMWYDTSMCTNCASIFGLAIDSAQHRVRDA